MDAAHQWDHVSYVSDASSCPSDEEGSTCSTETGDSFSSISAALESMCGKMEMFGNGIEAVADTVKHLETPVGSIALANFVQPRFLESAPFRCQRFTLQESAQKILGFERPTVKFATLCRHLREYCVSRGLVDRRGIITLNEDLKTLLETEEHTTTFLGLLTHLKVFVK